MVYVQMQQNEDVQKKELSAAAIANFALFAELSNNWFVKQ